MYTTWECNKFVLVMAVNDLVDVVGVSLFVYGNEVMGDDIEYNWVVESVKLFDIINRCVCILGIHKS